MERSNNRVIRVLVIDGGGIKGCVPVTILSEFERQWGVTCANLFDLHVGVSTGGLIAAGICYMGLSATDIESKFYTHETASIIFPDSCVDEVFNVAQLRPKYDGIGKREILESVFGPELTTEEVLGGDSRERRNVAITVYDVNRGTPVTFKSYDRSKAMRVLDLVDATSAAPAYFPLVNQFIDGSVAGVNIASIAYAEALELFGKDADIRVLSLGCGYTLSEDISEKAKDWGGIQWLTSGNLLSLLMTADNEQTDNTMEVFTKALGHSYKRINLRLDKEHMKLDDVSKENIQYLKRVAYDAFDRDDLGNEIREFLSL